MSQPQDPVNSAEAAAQVVARRVREIRDKRGWSAQKLAEKCAEAGAEHLDRDVLANLETGRRRNVSIDEVLVLALVLDVAPIHLFIDPASAFMHVGRWTVAAPVVREWVRGNFPLPSQDKRVYRTEVPEYEWEQTEARGASTPDEVKAFIEEHGGKIVYTPEEDA